MKVRITKRHIAGGVAMDVRRCPLALAMNERFDGRASVGSYVEVAGVPRAMTLAAHDFTADFDAGRPVSPGWLTVWE